MRRKEYKCAKSKYKQFSYLSAHWRTTVRRKFRLSAFNKSKYSSADNIANLYCHWLKYLQKDEIYVVLLSCAGKRERNQMPWYRLDILRLLNYLMANLRLDPKKLRATSTTLLRMYWVSLVNW